MSQRRLRTASLVALFVVTSFVAATACSSGAQHDEVTAGGAAGFDQAPSSLASGGAFVLEAGATSEGGESGTKDEAAAAGESSRSGQSNGGAPAVHASAGADNGGAPSPLAAGAQNGGTTNAGNSGAPGAGASDAGNSNAGFSSAGSSSGGTPNGGAPNGGAPNAGSAGSFVEPPACAPSTKALEPTTLYLPCEVNTALAVCWHCHGVPPASGTPYSLTTYAQVKAVAGLVYGTVLSNYMPRPPYTLTTTDKNALLSWLGKDGTCAVGMKLGCGQREE